MELEGRVAVVLGGSAGVGRAAVRQLVAQGASVVFQGRDPKRAAAIIDSLPPDRAHFMPADLYSYDQVDGVIASALDRFGRLDAVVASGGTFEPRPKPFADLKPDELPLYFETRLYHRLNAIHSAFNHMRGANYGKIVALTTDAGRIPTPAESLVGGAAAAQIFLTRALAREFAGYGIRINAVSISLTKETPSWERQHAQLAKASSEVIVAAFKKLEARATFGLCTPEEVAGLIVYLCSPSSDKLSGATISMNGGTSYPAY